MNSDQIIEAMKPYGLTNVYQGRDGTWSASCSLFIKGMTAEVRSGFGHPTMLSALFALQAKVGEVITSIEEIARAGKTLEHKS